MKTYPETYQTPELSYYIISQESAVLQNSVDPWREDDEDINL